MGELPAVEEQGQQEHSHNQVVAVQEEVHYKEVEPHLGKRTYMYSDAEEKEKGERERGGGEGRGKDKQRSEVWQDEVTEVFTFKVLWSRCISCRWWWLVIL